MSMIKYDKELKQIKIEAFGDSIVYKITLSENVLKTAVTELYIDTTELNIPCNINKIIDCIYNPINGVLMVIYNNIGSTAQEFFSFNILFFKENNVITFVTDKKRYCMGKHKGYVNIKTTKEIDYL